MPRDLTPEELESVREQELVDGAAAAQRAQTALQPDEGYVKLYDPRNDAMKFGAGTQTLAGGESTDDLIQFGQLEPGVAIVRADHPLLPRLLKRMPWVIVLEPGEVVGRVYACPDCDQEFTTKRKLRTHAASVHKETGAPPAKGGQKQAKASPADE